MATQSITSPVVYLFNSQPMTDSKKLAEFCEVRHKNALQKIDHILTNSQPEYVRRHFQPTSELVEMPNGGHREDRIYRMTRDGFLHIAMTFTGRKGSHLRAAVIDEFSRMEALLRNPSPLLTVESALEFLQGELKAAQDRASQAEAKLLQLTPALISSEQILSTCPEISRAVKLFKESKPNRHQLGDSAWTTIYLKEIHNISPKSYEKRNRWPRALFDESDIKAAEGFELSWKTQVTNGD